MKEKLTTQELHNLAMNIVGKKLEEEGYEFLGVNSQLKRDPQFVVLKEKKISFIVVRAIAHPEQIEDYDKTLLEKIREHAEKFNARTFYAGVGLGHGADYEKPVVKDEDFSLMYNGLIEIK